MNNPRTLPSIVVGEDKTLTNIDDYRVIIQEKVDGSQLTVTRVGNTLHYFNKNKQIGGQGKPWINSYLLLNNKVHLFKEGLFYHGEAMKSINSAKLNIRYEREPRYCWIVYEIVRSDNTTLTPEEMSEVLEGTGIEMVPIFYDNKRDGPFDNYIEKAKDIIKLIEDGQIKSCLGDIAPEGIVLKVLNKNDKKDNKNDNKDDKKDNKNDNKNNKVSTTRYKFVRKAFSEINKSKKQRLPSLNQDEIVNAIGDIYNTDARMQKAVQHLEEQGKWKNNNNQNIGLMVNELDNDLLKECEDEIKDLLFVRFWDQVTKASRSNLNEFMAKLS